MAHLDSQRNVAIDAQQQPRGMRGESLWQFVSGESRFRVPPGQRDEMEKLLACTTVHEMRDRLLEGKPLSSDGHRVEGFPNIQAT